MTTILHVDSVVKHFPIARGIVFQSQIGEVKAVDGVTFESAPRRDPRQWSASRAAASPPWPS